MARLTFLRGNELVNVAGESHYQEALRALTSTDGTAEIRLEVEAVLVPEPANPHDPNAVMVQIDGRLVGYLPRADAVAYGPMIAAVRSAPSPGRTGRRSSDTTGPGS